MSKLSPPRRFPARHAFASAIAGLTVALVSCSTAPRTTPPPAPVAIPPEAFAIPPGAREFAVQPGESLLQVFVYRGGSMARLGHNHVIASRHLAGVVYVTDDALRTRFDITLPVGDLTVDEPQLRESAGADFPREVPQNARDGTRKNMLSAGLLDAAQFPDIRLRAVNVRAAEPGYEVDVEVSIKDQRRVLRVPMQVTRDAAGLTARGEFPLKQTELGLTPFSAAMGALVVLDEVRVRFEVRAAG